MIAEWVLPVVSIVLGGVAGYGAAAVKIGRYAQMVDDLRDRLDKVEKDVKDISTELTKCSTKIDERTQSSPATLTKRKSPLSLSETGEMLLKASGSDKFVLENQADLVNRIKAKQPKSAYDVQEMAKEVVNSLENDERILPLKDYAYKEGIELESIFLVMSIFLRDIALPLLGYTPDDVDQSDPQRLQPHETKTV